MIKSFISLLTQTDDQGLYDVSKAAMARIKIRTIIIGSLALIVLIVYPLHIILSWLIPILIVDSINVPVQMRLIKTYEKKQSLTAKERSLFLFISWLESFLIAGLFIHISILETPHMHFIPYVVIMAATIYVISTMYQNILFLFGHLLIHNSAIVFVASWEILMSPTKEKGLAWAEFFASLVLIYLTIDIAKYFYNSYIESSQKTLVLNEALEHAQELTQLKSDLLSTVGHELRTPLNGILGFSKIMKSTTLSGKQTEYIDLIENAGKDINMLLSSIMDSEAIDHGRFVHNPIETNIPRLLYRLQKTFETVAQEKNVQISLDISEDFPTMIMIDETRLGQCVSNLLSNAIRFTKKGKITIRAFILYGKQNSTLHISVIDTGVGIPNIHRAKIFNKFFKADNQIINAEGTGLGLWLIRNIAQVMNGELNLISSSNNGSQFELKFNIKNADINSPENIGTLKNARVLHIEDTQTNLMLVRILLENKQASVVDAKTGAQALDLLQSEKFDMILCDLRLPDYNGNELLNDIRKLKNENANLPVIALTAQPEKIDNAATSNAFHTILSKPIDPNRLLSTLLKLN